MNEQSNNYLIRAEEYFRRKIPAASCGILDNASKQRDPFRRQALSLFENYKMAEINALSYEWTSLENLPAPTYVKEHIQGKHADALEKMSRASAGVQAELESNPEALSSYRTIEAVFKAAYEAGSLDFPEGFQKVEFMKDLLVVFRFSMQK